MTFVDVAKKPDGAGFRRNGEVVERACDVVNGIASPDWCGEHRLYQRGQAHAADQHGSCHFVAMSKPERGHDCSNSVGVLQSHGRSVRPEKPKCGFPPFRATGIDWAPTAPTAKCPGRAAPAKL